MGGRLLRQGVKFTEVRDHLEKTCERVTAAMCRELYDKILQQKQTYWVMDVEIDEIEDEVEAETLSAPYDTLVKAEGGAKFVLSMPAMTIIACSGQQDDI